MERPRSTFSWRQTRRALSLVAAGFVTLLLVSLATSMIAVADFHHSLEMTRMVATALVWTGVAAHLTILVGISWCCFALEPAVVFWAGISVGLYLLAIALAYIEYLLSFFANDPFVRFDFDSARIFISAAAWGLGLAALSAWSQIHAVIGRCVGAGRRRALVAVYVLACSIALAAIWYCRQLRFEPREMLAANLWRDKVAVMSILVTAGVLGGQLIFLRVSMAALASFGPESTTRGPEFDSDTTPEAPADAAWGLTKSSLIAMAVIAGVTLSVIVMRPEFNEGRPAPETDSGRPGILLIAALAFALVSSLCCFTPDRVAAWWARGWCLGVVITICTLPIAFDAIGRPLTLQRGLRLDDFVPNNLRSLEGLIGLTLVPLSAFITLSCLVQHHAIVGRRFGRPHVGVVGASFFAVSAGAFAIDLWVHVLEGGRERFPRLQAVVFADFVTPILIFGGYALLCCVTVRAIRGKPADGPSALRSLPLPGKSSSVE